MRYFTLLLLLCAGTLSSQRTLPDSVRLKEVNILATRLETNRLRVPIAVTSLSSDWIRTGQTQLTLQEALSITPGLLATNADNFAQDLRISIRGFGARSSFGVRGVRLLLDGLPETTTDGQGQLDNIDPGSLERIEVIRGATAGLYGNASGGVVSMQTEQPTLRPSLTLRSTVGSFGLQQHRLRVSGSKGKWGFNLNGAYTKIDGYRANSAAKGTVLNGKIVFKNKINLLFNYADSPQADDAGALLLTEAEADPRKARVQNVQFQAGESIRQGKLGITGRHNLGSHSLVQWHAFSLFRNFENRLPVQNSGIVQFDRQFSGAGVSFTNNHTVGGQNARLRVQMEVESQRDDRRRYQNNNGERGDLRLDQLEQFDNIGAGLQYDLPIGSHWSAMAALRYDWFSLGSNDRFLSDGDDTGSQNYHNINPLIGITYSARTALNLYANVASAFETPTLTELANPTGGGGFNPELRPQRSLSIELGAKGAFLSGWQYDVALYHIGSDNEISLYEIDSLPNRSFYRNAAETERIGIEYSIQIPMYRSLRLLLSGTQANYRYLKAPIEANNRKKLPGLPQQFGTFALQYMPRKGLFGVVQGQYSGKIYAEDSNQNEVPAVLLWTVRAGYRQSFKHFGIELYAGSNNLTDQRFYSNLRINAAANRYYEPGAGRMLYVGMKIMVAGK